MKRRSIAAIGVGVAAGAMVLLGGSLAQAATTDGPDTGETEVAITGSALEQASAAALAFTGEGAVTETEVGDEESYYEVEVTLDNGSEVDVQLDESFSVVGGAPDSTTSD